jgi:hypothetical protein
MKDHKVTNIEFSTSMGKSVSFPQSFPQLKILKKT